MKKLCLLLSFLLSGLVLRAQMNAETVKLIGLINPPGTACAIFEGQKTNGQSFVSEQIVLHENQEEYGVKLLKITSDESAVMVDFGNGPQSLALGKEDAGEMGSTAQAPAIRLHNVNSALLIELYGELKDRAILRHPKLQPASLSLTADTKDKSAAAAAVEDMFAKRDMIAIPDGDKFVMLVPAALTNSVTPRSADIAANSSLLPASSINFRNVPLQPVLQVYSQYIGREIVNLKEAPCCPQITLVQQNQLSREQICYGLETLFTWGGLRLVPAGDKALKIERIAEPSTTAAATP